MIHPFAAGNIAAARRDLRRCTEALRRACGSRADADAWRLIGEALGLAAQAEAQLADAMTLDEMAVTTGEENAA